MFVFQVQIGSKGQEFSDWKANQLKLCKDIDSAFDKKDAVSASQALKALSDNLKQKYGKSYELPELKKLGEKIDTLKQKWTVPPMGRLFDLQSAIGKLEEPKPAQPQMKRQDVFRQQPDTAKTQQAGINPQALEVGSQQWLDWQLNLAGEWLKSDLEKVASGKFDNKQLDNIVQNARDLAYNLEQIDGKKFEYAIDNLKRLSDHAAKPDVNWKEAHWELNVEILNKHVIPELASLRASSAAPLRVEAKQPKTEKEKQQKTEGFVEKKTTAPKEEVPAEDKKANLQQKVKVIPLDIVAGARQHMMSLNEDSGSDFRAKNLKMDTAGANQRFNFAISLMAERDGLDVTTTIGKGNRLLLSKEGEERLASLSEKERSVLFAIADMVAIRGEGNTKALLEKLTGGAKWSTDEFLAALWHEGESLVVKEMGLKDKASVRFWSEHFKKIVSSLAAVKPKEEKPKEKPEEKKEAPEKEEAKPEERELRKFGTERIKFRELERQIPPRELKTVDVPSKPPIMKEEAKPEGRAVARTAAKSFTTATSPVEPVSPKEKKEAMEAKKPEVVVKVGEEEEEAEAVVPATGTWVDKFSADKEIQEYCGKLSAEQKAKAAEWIKNNAEGTIIDKDRIGAMSFWVYAAERAK